MMPPIVHFTKYQGTGNDFIIIDARYSKPPSLSSTIIAALCHRRFGIGADGLMILVPHPKYDFEMIYYNSDGNTSSMCGNGGRCIAHHYMVSTDTKETTFLAVDGVHKAHLVDGITVALDMANVGNINKVGDDAYTCNTGSPHYIKFQNDKKSLQTITEFGAAIRYSDKYKESGINVNVIVPEGKVIHVATYERGVEDETYSCGTGVVAAALTANKILGIKSPIEIKTKGGTLQVSFVNIDEKYQAISLIGPASKVFKGEIHETEINIILNHTL